jgi:hypothetical protein
MKICIKCKTEQPLDNFVNNKNHKDGKHSTCKSCIKEYQQSIKDKIKEYQKEYQSVYRNEHRDKLMEYDVEWRANNREKVANYVKKSNAKNSQRQKDYMKVYSKLWYAKRKAAKLTQQND